MTQKYRLWDDASYNIQKYIDTTFKIYRRHKLETIVKMMRNLDETSSVIKVAQETEQAVEKDAYKHAYKNSAKGFSDILNELLNLPYYPFSRDNCVLNVAKFDNNNQFISKTTNIINSFPTFIPYV